MPVFSNIYTAHQPGQPPPPQPNLVPIALQAMGPMMPVQVEVPTALAQQLQAASKPIPTPVSGMALIDTGATISAVDISAVQKLGVQPTGVTNVGTAAGSQQQNVYPIRINLPAYKITFDVATALGATLTQQNLVVLLGRDFLQHFLLVYDGPHGIVMGGF